MNWKNKSSGAGRLAAAWCLAGLLGALGLALTVLPIAAQSQERARSSAKKKPRATVRTPAMSDALYKKLAAAQQYIEEDRDYLAASQVLDTLLDRPDRINGYELASIYNIYGYIYYAQEREADAVRAYNRVIADPQAIPLGMRINTLFTLAQLQLARGKFSRARSYLRDWFDLVEEPAPRAYILMAHCNYRLRAYKTALRNVRQAMRVARERGIEPKESWYLLLRTLHYEREEYEETAAVLRELLIRWPKREYWVQWGAMSGQLGRERKQLLIMDTAYQQDMLERGSMQLNLAYMLLAADVPYQAALVLKRGLEDKIIETTAKHLKLLGTAWRSAREDKLAIKALERAALLAEDGEISSQLARLYYDSYEYEKAGKAARAALAHKKLKRRGSVQLLLGMSLFQLDRVDAAKTEIKALLNKVAEALAKIGVDVKEEEIGDGVAGEKKRVWQYLAKRKQDVEIVQDWVEDLQSAERWLQYIDNEMRRRELLELEWAIGRRQRPGTG